MYFQFTLRKVMILLTYIIKTSRHFLAHGWEVCSAFCLFSSPYVCTIVERYMARIICNTSIYCILNAGDWKYPATVNRCMRHHFPPSWWFPSSLSCIIVNDGATYREHTRDVCTTPYSVVEGDESVLGREEGDGNDKCDVLCTPISLNSLI